ncbi:unnamed protein product [Blumeria hordei]|uniref:Uncharacterized protein n=1 Tax=Blumeria hordei TaxID=2867405 RepID=A0A383UIC9_BLUHO|nr:unnamed protein product [Blumeria hordei]
MNPPNLRSQSNMSYNQGPNSGLQRPYNGPAIQQQMPRQNYNTPQLSQQESQYQYDNNGYNYGNYAPAQDYSTVNQDHHSGARANGYPSSNQRYNPPQQTQDSFTDLRSFPSQRSRDVNPPVQRPATADGMRGGYRDPAEQSRMYSNNRPTVRDGNNPSHMRRSDTADSGRAPVARKPLVAPLKSPDQPAWDNPFPTFPGTQKKTSRTEEREILRKMETLEISDGQPSGPKDKQTRNANSRGIPSNRSEYPPGRNLQHGSSEDYGRMGPENSNASREYPPSDYAQGYSGQRRDMQRPGYGPSNNRNVYGGPGNDNGRFGNAPDFYGSEKPTPIVRSMTTPTKAPTAVRNAPLGPLAAGFGESYQNGPPRGVPTRPSTASGIKQQQTYFKQNVDIGPGLNVDEPYQNSHQRNESVSDLYDNYYRPENTAEPHLYGVEMPDFDANPAKPHRRGASFDEHIQAPAQNYSSKNVMTAIPPQTDARGMIYQNQPQAGEFVPNTENYRYDNWYENDPYNQGINPSMNIEYNDYNEPPPSTFHAPPRTTSAATYTESNGNQNYAENGYNDPTSGRYASSTLDKVSDDTLPLHPQPLRTGTISNSAIPQAKNKPMPIRNYNNSTPVQLPQNPSLDVNTVAKTNSPSETAMELESLRNFAKLNPTDQTAQLQLARCLVDASEASVQAIPDQRARNKTREKYIMDAHKILKKLAAQQYVEAMFFLADCYGKGTFGVEADYKEAFSLYQSAAKAGHAAAAYRTAVCCELGNEEGGGTRKDPLKAIQWYKRAATLGDTPAMYKMGIVLLKGLLGQTRNPREAIGWLKRAAERADPENPHALHELALLYEQPQATETSIIRDEVYSFQLFQQAADLGYKFSQFRLGCAYEYGLFNCPIDPRLSILWYSRAAAQEEHQSELALSGWYLTGSEGVLQQSDTEAYLWARKAALAGLAKAEYAMGYFTEVGIGSPGNLEDAKRWYWRAAAQNFPKARERLEDLKKGGSKAALRTREKISRSKKNNKDGLY